MIFQDGSCDGNSWRPLQHLARRPSAGSGGAIARIMTELLQAKLRILYPRHAFYIVDFTSCYLGTREQSLVHVGATDDTKLKGK